MGWGAPAACGGHRLTKLRPPVGCTLARAGAATHARSLKASAVAMPMSIRGQVQDIGRQVRTSARAGGTPSRREVLAGLLGAAGAAMAAPALSSAHSPPLVAVGAE